MTLRATARRLVGRSYFLTKQYELFRMRGGDAPLVVFSMGKTGSTAIARAVQDATGARVFQVFRLEADRLDQAEHRYLEGRRQLPSGQKPSEQRNVPFPGALHLWESRYLLSRPPRAGAPWTVISTVREPVAQAVSAFFHGGGRRGVPHGGASGGRASVEQLLDELLAEEWLRAPVRWFDREFAPALGIDVFEHPFPADRGNAVIETPEVRALLLRQEDLGAAPEALAGFLGRAAPVPVPARNQASTKAYGPRYQEFLASVRFPDAVLDEVYGSRYATHFYADSELQRFRDRWSQGPEPTAS